MRARFQQEISWIFNNYRSERVCFGERVDLVVFDAFVDDVDVQVQFLEHEEIANFAVLRQP